MRKSAAQRNALHLWMEQVADALNENSIDRLVVVEALTNRGLDMQWTGASFKESVYKPIFQKVSATESTEDGDSNDDTVVYNGLIRWFGIEFGIQLPPWPSDK